MKNARHPRYARHRFPAEVISHAVWLYFRILLSLRMVEKTLAAPGIEVSHETVRQWALKSVRALASENFALPAQRTFLLLNLLVSHASGATMRTVGSQGVFRQANHGPSGQIHCWIG